MEKGELPYHHAYERDGSQICPETGTDLSSWSGDSVRAHAENLYPQYARDNFSDEAKERRKILLEIADRKDK